jgi:acyl-coenzyme A synthetase/AMP-(fatty) acid ligase
MSYVESNLVPGETVTYETRLHWIVMLWHIVLGCLLLGLPGMLLLYYALSQTGIESKTLHVMEGGSIALLVSGAIAILMGMIRRNATEMAVTNRRVVIKTGLVNRKTIAMLLGKVETIEVNETAVGKMLGYGTIVGDRDGRDSRAISQSGASARISQPSAATIVPTIPYPNMRTPI